MSSSSSEEFYSTSCSSCGHPTRKQRPRTQHDTSSFSSSSSSYGYETRRTGLLDRIEDELVDINKSVVSMMIGADLLELQYNENRHIINALRQETQELLDFLLEHNVNNSLVISDEIAASDLLEANSVVDRFFTQWSDHKKNPQI
jgi:hypothetical protein